MLVFSGAGLQLCAAADGTVSAAFQHNRWLIGSLLMGESMLTAFSFLLICQFMIGRIPPLPYWLVLAIPLVGGGELIYASMMQAGDTAV